MPQQQPENKTELVLFRFLHIALGVAIFFLPISKALLETGAWTALSSWFLLKIIRHEKPAVPPSIWIPYAVFFLFCSISIFLNAGHWELGLRGLSKYLRYFGLFFVLYEIGRDHTKANKFILVFLAGMLLVTASGFFQLYYGHDFLRNVTLDPGRIIRMKSSLGAPTTLATFYCFTLPLAFYQWHQFRKQRILWSAVLAVFILAFVLTFSRGAFFALALAALLTLCLTNHFKAAAALIATLAAAVLLIEPMRYNFLESLQIKDITIGERLKHWTYTWEMIRTHPFFGIGLNMYHARLPEFLPPDAIHRYAHNSYLQMWAETGIAGLIAFLCPLLVFFVRQVRSKLRGKPLEACLFTGWLAFLIGAFVDNHFYALQMAALFWIFWGLLAGTGRRTA